MKKQHTLGFYKKNDDVETPREFYNELDSIHHFDFDPCPFKSDFDGLESDWGKCNYVNPPFSKIKAFVRKAVTELKKGNKSVFLITTRTNSNYWQDYIFPNATDYMLLKGITFEGFTREIPMPLCVIEFDPTKDPIFRSSTIGSTKAWQQV